VASCDVVGCDLLGDCVELQPVEVLLVLRLGEGVREDDRRPRGAADVDGLLGQSFESIGVVRRIVSSAIRAGSLALDINVTWGIYSKSK
jgi:hypothetical protein